MNQTGNGVGDGSYASAPYGAPPPSSGGGGGSGQGKRGLLGLGFAVVGIVAFAGTILVSYRGGDRMSGDGPPLLTADPSPTKSRPEQPGGMDVPHQDKLVYERLHERGGNHPNVERLLPPPEVALPRPVVTPQMPSLPPMLAAPVIGQLPPPPPGSTATVPRDSLEPTPAPTVAAAPQTQASATATKPGATPTGKPPVTPQSPTKTTAAPTAQTAALPPPAAPKPAPTAPVTVAPLAKPTATAALPAPTPAPVTVKPAPTPIAPPPAAAPRASITAVPVAPPPSAATQTPLQNAANAAKPAAPPPAPQQIAAAPVPPPAQPAKPAPAITGGSGNWRIQLASVRSETEAAAEWKRLASRHSDALGGLSFQVAKVDLAEKGIFYRVQGNGADETRAKSICAQLRAQNVGCVVVRP